MEITDSALNKACQEDDGVKVKTLLSSQNIIPYSSLIIALDDRHHEIASLHFNFIEEDGKRGIAHGSKEWTSSI